MDFKIVACNNYATASQSIIDMLKNTNQKNLQEHHVVITNDRCRMTCEFEILDALGGSFNTEVFSFARLTTKLMQEKPFISKESAIMLISKLAEDMSKRFLCFTKSFDTPGFASNVYDTISQFKYCNLAPDKIDVSLFDKNLQYKMHDIKLLYQAYEDFIKDRYIDSGAKLNELIKQIKTSDYVKNSSFYIKDFDNFSTQEVLIIRELIIYAKSVVVAIPYVKDRRIYNYSKSSFDDMLDLAKGLKIEPKICYVRHNQPNFVGHIENNLFDYKQEFKKIDNADVHISKESDVFGEVETVAKYIISKTRQGDRYKDFLVVASDVANYSYAFERVFGKYGIAYFLDNKAKLSSHALSQFVVDIFVAKQTNFRREECLSLAKNYFYNLQNKDDISLMENVCLKNNYRFFGKPFDGICPKEVFAEEIRQQIVAFVEGFDIKPNDLVSNYISKIRVFLQDANTVASVQNLAKMQENIDMTLCKISAQVLGKLNGVLDNIEALFGQETTTSEKFLTLLQTGIEAESISVLPLYNDCVVVTNVAKSRANGNKHLVVVGANDGAFPVIKQDTKIVSDGDIDNLSKFALDVKPKIEAENNREKFNVYQLLTAPRQSLFITYISTSEVSTPCLAVEEIEKMFDLNQNFVQELKQTTHVFSSRQAQEKLVDGMSKISSGNNKFLVETSTLHHALKEVGVLPNDGMKKHLYLADKDKAIQDGKQILLPKGRSSITKIETFYKCPHRYFLQHGLKLSPRDLGELKAVDTGTILHDVLEKFINHVFIDKKPFDVANIEEVANSLLDDVLVQDKYKYIANHPKLAHVLTRVRSEGIDACKTIYNNINNSSFKPYATEMSFGFGGEGAKEVVVEVDENRVLLNGKIDRVDVCDNQFVIIDYKTGKVSFTEKEVYVGEKLQLLTYVKAAKEGLQNKDGQPKECVGFFYQPINSNFQDDNAERFVYTGRVVNDKDVLNKLDKGCVNAKYSTLLNKQIGNNGISRGNMGIAKQDVDVYLKYTDVMLKNAIKNMADGTIIKKPQSGACSYCDYAKVCNFLDLGGKEVEVKDIDKKTLQDIVNKGQGGQNGV